MRDAIVKKKINRILLVDDDNVTNNLNKTVISNVNIANEVILKTNGREAISFLKEECTDENYPDLLLLDLKMPVMDGFEFLKEFEKICQDLKHNIYVVILTTSKSPEDFIKLRELGNYYYVEKPLTKDNLLDLHHRYFRNLNFH